MPSVSVVIATYGRPAIVIRAIQSALVQTMIDLEVVVVVENGDQETIVALETIMDYRVRYVINPKKLGPGAARDFGVKSSAGRRVAFLDDDDEWLPTKLEKQLAAIGDSEAVIAMTLSRVVTPVATFIHPTTPYAGDQPIDEWLFGRTTWLKGGESMIQTSSLMVPRALFEILNFGQSRHEEWELVIRAIKRLGYRLVTVNEPLVVYYSGNTSYPWNKSVDWVEHVRDLLTPRAFSGFCLTVATKGLNFKGRNHAFIILLRLGLTKGRPTVRQLFAFLLIWLMPDRFRHRLRGLFSKHDFSKKIKLQ